MQCERQLRRELARAEIEQREDDQGSCARSSRSSTGSRRMLGWRSGSPQLEPRLMKSNDTDDLPAISLPAPRGVLPMRVIFIALLTWQPARWRRPVPVQTLARDRAAAAGRRLRPGRAHAGGAVAALLGQPVVVENRPGGGTVIGTDAWRRPSPMATRCCSALRRISALRAGLYKELPYNPKTDFVPLGLAAGFSYTLVARTEFAPSSLKEIVDYARANPGKLTYASAGNGSGQHICAALVWYLAGVNVTHVPYKGAQAVYQDLIPGRVDLFFDASSTARGQVEGGRVKPLAVSGPARLGFHPATPTVRESGLIDFEIESWAGYFVRAGTPAAVLSRLRSRIRQGGDESGDRRLVREARRAADAHDRARGRALRRGRDRQVDAPDPRGGHYFGLKSMAQPFGKRLLDLYTGGVLTKLIDIGCQTGLFEASVEGAATSDELAARAGLDERYVREWLGAMATSGIFLYDAASGRYRLPQEHAVSLTGAAARNVSPMSGIIDHFGKHLPRLVKCFREGGGIPYSEYRPEFTCHMDATWRRIYDELLISGFLGRISGLTERLAAGIGVLDVGCGSGHAVNVMAREFPRSRFVGYDLAEDAIADGRAEASRMGLANVRFDVLDVAKLPGSPRFALVTAFDAIHDQTRPSDRARAHQCSAGG